MTQRSHIDQMEHDRLCKLADKQDADEIRVMPGFQTQEHLLEIVKRLPTDVEPWGKRRSVLMVTAPADVAGTTSLPGGSDRTGVSAPILQVRGRVC